MLDGNDSKVFKTISCINYPSAKNEKNNQKFNFDTNINKTSNSSVTNFFEKRVGDYGKLDEDSTSIEFNEEF